VQALRVKLTEELAYWSVVDDAWLRVPVADDYLRYLRLGRDRAEGTTRAYAGDLALFLGWCEASGRDLMRGAQDLALFVAVLKTTPVVRPGAGQGAVRGARRINHVLTAVRELYKHAVANKLLDASVLALLYEVGDDAHLPADLRAEGSGLRYVARPRHVQRARRRSRPAAAVRQDEAEALLRAARSWRDRLMIVLLWFCGLRIGEVLGLRRSDLHFLSSSRALGCALAGAHLHVVARDNPNGAQAKSGSRHVPVRAEVLACYDHYLAERQGCPQAEACDFVLVNLFHAPLGQPMSDHTLRPWLNAISIRAGLDRPIHPHMFRHATATELLARGTNIDVVKELLGHASIRSTEAYLHPSDDALRAAVDRLGPLPFGGASGERP
jgi:integrase/recombinase XerD